MKKLNIRTKGLTLALILLLATKEVFCFYGAPQADSIVARFGNFNISMEEFRIAYLDLIKRPNVFDSKEMREGFLNELIATRLMANEAKKIGLDKDTLFNYKINAYRNKCLREANYDSVIKPKIEVTEKEVEDAYQYTQEERKLSHLFFKTKEEADSAYNRLLRGAKFEDIAREVFNDTLLKNNGGSLGWVNWEALDYDLADAAFKLLPDTFTKPVKSQYGYHILRMTDFKKKPLITMYEYQVQKKKTKYLVEFKKGQQLSYGYVSNMIKNAKVQVYPRVMKFLRTKLNEQLKRKPNVRDAAQEFQLSEEEMNRLEVSLWDARNEVVAAVNGKNYTIGEFLSNLNFIPYEVVYSNFEKTFDFSLRDFLLTNEAVSMGLDKNETVQKKTNLYSEYYLRLGLARKLVAGITVSEDEMKQYYADHRAGFKQATYDTCRYVINLLITNRKKENVIPDFVKAISKNMNMDKYFDVIHRYYDGISNGDIY